MRIVGWGGSLAGVGVLAQHGKALSSVPSSTRVCVEVRVKRYSAKVRLQRELALLPKDEQGHNRAFILYFEVPGTPTARERGRRAPSPRVAQFQPALSRKPCCRASPWPTCRVSAQRAREATLPADSRKDSRVVKPGHRGAEKGSPRQHHVLELTQPSIP